MCKENVKSAVALKILALSVHYIILVANFKMALNGYCT